MDGAYFQVQKKWDGKWLTLTGLRPLDWCKAHIADDRKYCPGDGPRRIVEKITDDIYDVVPGTEG